MTTEQLSLSPSQIQALKDVAAQASTQLTTQLTDALAGLEAQIKKLADIAAILAVLAYSEGTDPDIQRVLRSRVAASLGVSA